MAADFAQTPAAAPPPVEEIVVTGTRGSEPRKPRPDAVEILRTHCFEPARLTRRFDEPSPGPRWIELDDKERRQFQMEESDVPAYAMDDESRAQRLWLKFERLRHKSNAEELKCTLLVMGGRDHDRFVGDMSSLFRGAPTQRHVGHRAGSPALAGWEQWLWTGMPSRPGDLDNHRRAELGTVTVTVPFAELGTVTVTVPFRSMVRRSGCGTKSCARPPAPRATISEREAAKAQGRDVETHFLRCAFVPLRLPPKIQQILPSRKLARCNNGTPWSGCSLDAETSSA